MAQVNRFTAVLPDTADVSGDGHLLIGGCDCVLLAEEFGTPLYVFDEATLRGQCQRFRDDFEKRYTRVGIVYAAKALLNRALAKLIMEESLGLDVVSGGELSIAKSVDFPMERVYFHGNNKGRDEIDLAMAAGVGRIVIDNMHELELVENAAASSGVTQPVLLRLTPNIDPHTHRHTTTGVVDSKFGFAIDTGQAQEAVAGATEAPHLHLIGLHAHLGSPIYSTQPYEEAVAALLRFAAEMAGRYGLTLQEFSPGGGFAVQYTLDRPAPTIADYAEAIAEATKSNCSALGMERPLLTVEPGRSIVARAGVALYRVGAIKEVPGVRKYASVDGGMADNIRPALYDSRYEAIPVRRMNEDDTERVTIAGKFCESGDILVRDAQLPDLEAGDILALPVSGAYCLPMASNYNASLRSAVVFVRDGNARLVRRRETYEDLMRNDLL